MKSLLVPFIFLLVLVIQYFTLPCSDLTWLAWVDNQMLHGAKIYRDVLEPAPPLILWLYALPVALAEAFAWSPVLAIKAFAFMLAAGSIAACNALLKRSAWNEKERATLLIWLTGILLLLPNGFIVFAQREHLLVILLLPYVIASLPSLQPIPRWVNIAIGVAACIGLCIKPHFFAIWLAALLYRRRINVMDVTIAAGALMYLGVIALFVPQYFDWLHILAPLYGYYGRPADNPFTIGFGFALMAICGLALAWVFGLFRSPSQDTRFLTYIAVGAYAEALLQFKAWDYIDYPVFAFGTLALLPAMLRRTDLLTLAIMALVFYPTTAWNNSLEDMARKHNAKVLQALAPYANSPDIYFIDDYMPPSLLFRNAPPMQWQPKFNFLNFLLFGIMERSNATGYPTNTVRPGQEEHAHWLLKTVADDVAKKQPQLLVVIRKWDPNLPEQDQYFDMEHWLMSDVTFRRTIANYRLAGQEDLCQKQARHCTYMVYTRQP